jgi:choline dehydrogenase
MAGLLIVGGGYGVWCGGVALWGQLCWYHHLFTLCLFAVLGYHSLGPGVPQRSIDWDALPVEADESVEHDYIVVGAGCAGCALTASLAQAGKRVLLLEFGPATAGERPLVRSAKQWWRAAMSGYPISMPYRTSPQGRLGQRKLQAYRGVGGGGSGNVNAGLWSRGRREDYVADWPWDIADIERSFNAVESSLGVARVAATGPGLLFGRMATEAGYAAVDGGGWVHDGWESGIISTFAPVSGDTGERRGGFQKFVSPLLGAARGGSGGGTSVGVQVMDHFKVARVILQGGEGDRQSERGAERPCRAIGIEVAVVDGATGEATSRKRLLLRNVSAEVVLCAGAIETPKILMLSGVGSRQELAALGVECLVHCEHVGKNLQVRLSPGAPAQHGLPMPHTLAWLRGCGWSGP